MKITIAEIIEYFEQDFQKRYPTATTGPLACYLWEFSPEANKAAAACLKDLEAAGRTLLEWQDQFPEDIRYNNESLTQHVRLTFIIERFRALLGPSTADPMDERIKRPPCMECGAMTAKEAETKCHCGGDKDSCHGSELWPEG